MGNDTEEIGRARNGAVEIAYQTFGAPGGEPLLLIAGLDFQMVTMWPDGFGQALADRGFRVARFDNRDTGLSTHVQPPASTSVSPLPVLFRRTEPAYTAADMAADGVAVMDALGWESAHVMGGSMGGGLALATAILFPGRVRTVTFAMGIAPSATLSIAALRYVNLPGLARFGRIGRLADGPVAAEVEVMRMLASPGHPFDEDWARSAAEVSHARAPRDPGTTRRHLAAGRASIHLYRRLGEITAPVLILHGADDPVARVAGARAMARRLRGARLVIYPAMGHEIPRHLWDTIADDVAALAGLRA
ncbi:MAG TPA: alpha/beta hydrolase [Streptosporangiaceae bacterium]|nr:alpha/beta hydrolase [Streptosporangiaceae bacterium]